MRSIARFEDLAGGVVYQENGVEEAEAEASAGGIRQEQTAEEEQEAGSYVSISMYYYSKWRRARLAGTDVERLQNDCLRN